MIKFTKLAVILCFAATALTAKAQVIYNSRAAFDLAHPINYVIDFNGYTPGPFQYASVTAPTPYGDVLFVSPQGNVEFLGNGNIPFLGAGNLALYAFNGQPFTDSLTITLSANSFSFGTDVISPSTTVPEPYQFTIFSGSTVLAIVDSPSVSSAYTFIGYDSLTSPITSIKVQIANAVGSFEPTLDNFTVVPEPSTWLASGFALAAMVFVGRRRARIRG